jgi:hypothetical protein
MKHFGKQPLALWSLPVVLLLSGCGEAAPECDTSDTRNSVVTIVASNKHNPLVKYAARNSTAVQTRLGGANTDAEKSGILEEADERASYALDAAISTNSTSRDNREVTCSGVLSATVDDATAQKQVDFKVQKAPDGRMSVSVTPFQF